jgi:ChrR Cupin-like domain
MNTQPFAKNMTEMLEAIRVDDVTPVEVGKGCFRRDLPSTAGVRVWIVDISPGGEWPHVDQHDAAGEELYVVSGELIEGDLRFGRGTYVFFKPGSSHRPRSEKGVRLFGFNLANGSPSANG